MSATVRGPVTRRTNNFGWGGLRRSARLLRIFPVQVFLLRVFLLRVFPVRQR